jgi:5-formyltetrahydrofolate cyclo-ligase
MSKVQSSAAPAGKENAQGQLRKRSLAARTAMTPQEREEASAKITESVVRSAWFRRARLIACYLPMQDEVDTWMLIARAWRMKKRVFAPVIEKNFTMTFCEVTPKTDLLYNRYGLPEPREGDVIDVRSLDLVMTPLVAFDADCNRIGMGGGYFDRTFSFLRMRQHLFHPKLIGLAFACQEVEKVAANPWDIRLFRVIDELTRTERIGRNR